MGAIARWLGIIRWGRALTVIVTLCTATAVGGFWAGSEWEVGRAAKETLKVERVATARGESASAAHAQRTDEIRTGFMEADRDLSTFIRARSDLWDCDVGDDGLQLIRSWDAIGTGAARGPAPSLPDTPARAGERPGAASTREPEG